MFVRSSYIVASVRILLLLICFFVSGFGSLWLSSKLSMFTFYQHKVVYLFIFVLNICGVSSCFSSQHCSFVSSWSFWQRLIESVDFIKEQTFCLMDFCSYCFSVFLIYILTLVPFLTLRLYDSSFVPHFRCLKLKWLILNLFFPNYPKYPVFLSIQCYGCTSVCCFSCSPRISRGRLFVWNQSPLDLFLESCVI